MTEASCNIEVVTLAPGVRAVRMSNPFLHVEILPDKGADIYSIIHRKSGIDVLWKSPVGLRAPGQGPRSSDSRVAWMESYEGGWQELFPHCGSPEVYKGLELGFHGEASTLPWQFEIVKESGEEIIVNFSARLIRSPFTIHRSMIMTAASGCITLRERVTNRAAESMDFRWGHHPAFGAPFLSDKLRLLTNARTIWTDASRGTHCKVKADTKSAWPHTQGRENGQVDLSRFCGETEPNNLMSFLRDFDGAPWYALINPELEFGIGMSWSADVFSMLWFWQEMHACSGFPFHGRTYTIALEPMSSYPVGTLDPDHPGPQLLTLDAGASLESELVVTLFDVDGMITEDELPVSVRNRGQ